MIKQQTTLCGDYVIDARDFHWQSQNNTRSERPKGRHTHHEILGITPLIFARTAKKTDYGLTMPYQVLGQHHTCLMKENSR